MSDDISDLTQLGSNQTNYDYSSPSADILETFENRYPERPYEINLIFPEFTSLCPKTGQPDFAEIRISYIADKKCVESKSLKLYMFSWRNEGTFMETITNRILNDLVSVLSPVWIAVVGDFAPRGGLKIVVEAEYHRVENQD